MGLKSFFNGVFGTAATNEVKNLRARLAAAESELRDANDHYALLQEIVQENKATLEQVTKERNTLQLQVVVLKKELAPKDIKLSDGQAKKQLRELTKAKIKQLEEQLNAAPESLQGATMVFNKRTKKVGLVEFKSKTEALELVKKAKSGSIRFV